MNSLTVSHTTPIPVSDLKENIDRKPVKIPMPVPKAEVEEVAHAGLHSFFGARAQKVNGLTHSERIMSAARTTDVVAFQAMLMPGIEGADSLRKLTTATGKIIDAHYDANLKAAHSSTAEKSRSMLAALEQQQRNGKLTNPASKRQYMQALAHKVFTSPIINTAGGREVRFGELGDPASWEHISREDLSNSDVIPKLASVLSDCEKIYRISESFPVNRQYVPPKKTAKEKGLRKLWQETKKGNFSEELTRQGAKYWLKSASLAQSKPYEQSTLDEVFAFEIRSLARPERESIEKKLLENQVRQTMKQAESLPTWPSPGKLAKTIKQKKNYQFLRFKDKDAYLAQIIDREVANKERAELVRRPVTPPDDMGEPLRNSSDTNDHEYYESNTDLHKALMDWRIYQRGFPE